MVYENLKAAIKQAIKQNGNQEITGNLLQSTLLNIVNTLGADYKFLGFASPSTVPPTSEEGRLFYFASKAGEYINFPTTGENTQVVTGEGLYLFTKEADSDYWKAEILIEILQELGTDKDKVLSQRESSLIASYNSEVINYRTENTKGFLSSTNTFIDTETYVSKTTGYIKVKEGDVYLYRGISRDNGFGCLVFNKDFKVIKTFKAESENDYVEFVMPENAYCARFSSFVPTGSNVILDVIPKSNLSYTNNLSFKKWIACGDSFTHGDFTGYDGEQLLKATFDYGPYSGRLKVYPFYIGNRVKNFIVKNEAKNGLTLRDFVKNETYKSICETYNRIDYITLYFGINDDHQNVTIGTIDDTLEDNTFYGYWNTLLTYLVTNFTNIRIGIIVSNGLGSSEYSKAERAVAKKYGIPYLDFAADEKLPYLIRQNERSDISPAIKKIKEDYFAVSSTNRHPNEKAHSIESEFIEQFLLSL